MLPATPAIGAVAFLFATLAGAQAGEINSQNGIAIKGRDPVAYFREGRPVAGLPQFTADHKGATFLFASSANRDAFKASPDVYAPQYGGFCAYGTSRGYKADVDPDAFTVTDGKLYLNYSQKIKAEWSQDIPGYVAKANAQWPKVVVTDKVYR